MKRKELEDREGQGGAGRGRPCQGNREINLFLWPF